MITNEYSGSIDSRLKKERERRNRYTIVSSFQNDLKPFGKSHEGKYIDQEQWSTSYVIRQLFDQMCEGSQLNDPQDAGCKYSGQRINFHYLEAGSFILAEMTFLPSEEEISNKLEYCIKVILKEAKLEDRLVRQVLYTMLSMYTNDPRNLAVNSPTGEGKNYVIRKVADLFPKEDVIKFVGMSDKSLFHRPGLLVIKNERGEYEPIDEIIRKIDSDIEDKLNEANTTNEPNLKRALKAQVKDLEREKGDLYKRAKKLIDLSHKTLIFLDTPRPELLNTIMSLLSHDEYEVEYDFVDTNNGIKTKSNVLRGWPAVMFAQSIDFSHYKRYPEIQRRFIITNPKMDQEKYKAAIELTFDKYGLPDFMYQEKIVCDTEKEQAREFINGFKESILDMSTATQPGRSNVLIPFAEAISTSLSAKKSSDMTVADRMCGYLTLLPAVNIENRPILLLRKQGEATQQRIPLATFDDLKETLFLMQYSTGLRPYVLEWYEEVLLPTYRKKTTPDKKTDSRGYLLEEDIIAVTSQQLADATFEIQHKKLSTKQVRESFLEPLINEGYIDKVQSNLNKSADIYIPVIDTEKVGQSGENGQTSLFSHKSKIIVEDRSRFPDPKYIISKIGQLLQVAYRKGILWNNKFNIAELVEEYYRTPKDYFIFKEHESAKAADENATSQNAESDNKSGESLENNVNIPTKEGEKSIKRDEIPESPRLPTVVTENNGNGEKIRKSYCAADRDENTSLSTDKLTQLAHSVVTSDSSAADKQTLFMSRLTDLADKNGGIFKGKELQDTLVGTTAWTDTVFLMEEALAKREIEAVGGHFDTYRIINLKLLQENQPEAIEDSETLDGNHFKGYSHLIDLRHYHPFVKWAGGKTQIIDKLDSMIPTEFNRYFEPFLGGGAMFFHLLSVRNMRFTAYLSDINKELITAYKAVKDNVRELVELLKKHEIEYRRDPFKYYYKLRDEVNPLTDIEIAGRFIALNKTCYNGLYRVNSNGKFNVPMGRYKNPVICDSTNLENVSNALRYSKAVIQVADYKGVLLNAKKDDFIYLDPPYHPVSSTANFTSYTNYGFGNNNQLELAKILVVLNDRGCKVLLSNSDTPFIRRLYSDFYFKEVNVSRSINSQASRRKDHKELLISNYTPSTAGQKLKIVGS